IEQRLTEASPAADRGGIPLRQPLGELACETHAVRVDAARGKQHDRIARPEPLSEREARVSGYDPEAGRRQIDALRLDDAGERRRLTAAPGDAARIASRLPSAHQIGGSLDIGKPVAAACRPVRLDGKRSGSYGDEIVDGHRDRVLRDGVVVAAPGDWP